MAVAQSTSRYDVKRLARKAGMRLGSEDMARVNVAGYMAAPETPHVVFPVPIRRKRLSDGAAVFGCMAAVSQENSPRR
jgi:hypothetical protein